jgi:transporter family protein
MWIYLALASSAFIGLYEVARKAAVTDSAALPTLLAATLGGLASLLPLAILSISHGELLRSLGLDIVLFGPREQLLIFYKSLLVTASWAFSYSAVRSLPISTAGPVRATSPLFTAIFAVLLFAERPTPLKWLGIAVLIYGYLSLATVSAQEGIVFRKNRAVWLLFSGTLLGSLSGLYDKYLLQQAALPVTSVQFWFTFDNALLQLLLVLTLHRRDQKKRPFRFSFAAPLAGVLLVLADQLYLHAVSDPQALISVISVTRRASVLVSFAVGGWLFREQLLRAKLRPLAFVLLGVVLLVY